MADPLIARPVSGEIMADGPAAARPPRGVASHADLIEADFEVVPTIPSVGGGEDARPDIGDGMDILRRNAHGPVRSNAFGPGGSWFWLSGLALVLAAFWISGGHAIVARMVSSPPGETGPMMVISDVASRVDVTGPKPLLFVDGKAGNSGVASVVMPELEIRVTGNDGRITRYNLGTSGRTMGAGETFAFSSRLDVPKNGVKTVSVAFVD